MSENKNEYLTTGEFAKICMDDRNPPDLVELLNYNICKQTWNQTWR